LRSRSCTSPGRSSPCCMRSTNAVASGRLKCWSGTQQNPTTCSACATVDLHFATETQKMGVNQCSARSPARLFDRWTSCSAPQQASDVAQAGAEADAAHAHAAAVALRALGELVRVLGALPATRERSGARQCMGEKSTLPVA
jgi:hypothetical protein